MSIKVGDKLPDGKLTECSEFDPETQCPINPVTVDVAEACQGKKIVLFAVPGAFTPTCSLKHLPGYIAQIEALRSKGVDEVWCLSVNDHFVMAAWGRDQKAFGKVRMMADGSAHYVKALGLDRDLSANGMGIRSQRFAIIADRGIVKYVGVEASGKFEVSNVEAVLTELN
jgi:peroxiredoxin